MFRVAICDDNQSVCANIESIILNKCAEIHKKIDVEVFYSGEDLIKFIQNEHVFDLLFIDIEFPKMNGIEIGRKIREEMKDDITQIIFISGKHGYAMDLFEIRPLNFLIKPISNDKIVKYLMRAMHLLDKSNLFYEFSIRKALYKIPLKDIIYFESIGKKIRVNTTSESYEHYGKLSDTEKAISCNDFLLIHKSYLVNYLYIFEAHYEFLKITNGMILPISQPYRKKTRDTLIRRRKKEVKNELKQL